MNCSMSSPTSPKFEAASPPLSGSIAGRVAVLPDEDNDELEAGRREFDDIDSDGDAYEAILAAS